jgi:hypothetical protein
VRRHTPIPRESAIRLLNSIHKYTPDFRLNRIIVDVLDPEIYVDGRVPSTDVVQTVLQSFAADHRFTPMRCEWGSFEDSGTVLCGIRGEVRIPKVESTVRELQRITVPALLDLLHVYRTCDAEGVLSRLSKLRLLWTYKDEAGWELLRYDLELNSSDKEAITLESFLSAMERFESRFPTLRTARIDVRIKEGLLTQVRARLHVYRLLPRP